MTFPGSDLFPTSDRVPPPSLSDRHPPEPAPVPGGFRTLPRLIWHPAGLLFTLSALSAVALPWAWALPLTDGHAHLRLAIFGFAGAAVSGYVLTALPAWAGRGTAIPAALLAALAIIARASALVWPGSFLPLLPLALIGCAVLWPVLIAGNWAKLPIAAAPLALAGSEALIISGRLQGAQLPMALAALILVVGGRAIPAFLNAERKRNGKPTRAAGPVWPALALLVFGAVSGVTLALALVALWVLHRAARGIRAGAANRILCLAYAGLAPGLAAPVLNLSPMIALHLLTLFAIGPMILAFASRITMTRRNGSLIPRRRHLSALALILAAAALRPLGETHPQALWLAGAAWSLAWALILSAHLPALLRPAPFPVFSAAQA